LDDHRVQPFCPEWLARKSRALNEVAIFTEAKHR